MLFKNHNMQAAVAFVLFAATVALAHSAAIVDVETAWMIPQDDGTLKLMTRDEYKHLAPDATSRKLKDIKFFLYTNANPNAPQTLTLHDKANLQLSHFDANKPTRITIHGWKGNYKADVNTKIRDALLSTGDYNVITVDWSENAQTNYISARNAVVAVGKSVGEFINYLRNSGVVTLDKLTIIGHSLGAHVAGFAGKSVANGKVHEIIGLDPAFPLFDYSDCNARLCNSDATFVESITTNGGLLGFLKPIGKLAFYPNGGKKQPGCGIDIDGSCSHSRSVTYYAEAIKRNDFPAIKCNNYQNAVDNKCGNTYSSVKMGAPTNFGLSGYYYVPVKDKVPYGMGA